MQRRKGATGERELAHQLREWLGCAVTRNLEQARSGGCDLLGIPGWAIECKRAARPRLSDWWRQCCEQAQSTEARPALCYRLDRQPWRVMLALRDVADGFHQAPLSQTVETSLEVFAALVRERLIAGRGGTARAIAAVKKCSHSSRAIRRCKGVVNTTPHTRGMADGVLILHP